MSTAPSTMALPAAPPDAAFPLRLLSDELGIDRELADPAGASRLLVPLTGWVVAGFGLHAACVTGLAWTSMGPDALPYGAAWFAASTGGFFAAICAGLPSYWFYGVVAKLRAPAWRLAAELVRIQAIGSVVLAGMLPFWFAGTLGLHLAFGVDAFEQPAWRALTLALPFLCGTPGLAGLYRGFVRMRSAVQDPGRLAPAVLTAWWSLLFVSTGPVAMHALFRALSP